MRPFSNPEVAAKFNAYPAQARGKLLVLRDLVFEVAAATPGVGVIEECLKWGEPAYVTRNGSGSTVRIDWKAKNPDRCAIYFNCRTTLVETFRWMFPDDFEFTGNRALVLRLRGDLPKDALAVCIAAALTYHLAKLRPGSAPAAAL